MALQLRAKRFSKPKFKVAALVLALALALQPLSVGPVAQALADAVSINEVMPNPVSIGDAAGEWVELKNNGSADVDISGWTIASATVPTPASITGGGLYVLCKTSEATTECDGTSSGLSLTNSSQTVTLKNASDEVVDTFTYSGVTEGESIEVVRENGSSAGQTNSIDSYSTNQVTSNANNTGTPGALNRAQATATEVTNVRTGMVYDDLQLAADDAQSGDTLQLNEDISTSRQVTITKALTIDGGGHEIDAAFLKTDNGNNSALGVQADDVTIRNVSLTSSADEQWPKQLHGINVFEAQNVAITNVTVYEFEGSGIAYNGSTGTIQNVNTAGNGWHGINVDKTGASVTIQGVNTHNEAFADIYVDNDTVAQVTAPSYDWERSNRPEAGYGNDRVYRLKQVEACNDSTFDSFTLGSVNGQNGWKATNTNIDQAVVDNTYGYEAFGCKTLRISNSFASGSFGDQTFSAPAATKAGENETNDRYEASFSFGTATQDVQPGLALSVSPDDGIGNRMSYVGLTDTAGGTALTFYDTDSEGNFRAESIGTFDRDTAHAVKFEIEFKDGPSNDIVKLYVDDSLAHTGTTWEQYYRESPEQAGNGNVVPSVDRLLIRAAGTAAPATVGNGFVFDQMTVATTQTDTTAPEFAITSPANQSLVSDTTKISAQITDASGIQKVLMTIPTKNGNKTYVYEDGKTNNSLTKDGDSYYVNVDTNILNDGMAYVVLRGTDKAGNTRYWNNNAATRQHSFIVDNSAPDVAIANPTQGAAVRNTVNIRGTVTDANPKASYLRITGPSGYVVTSYFADGRTTHEYAWSTTGLADGSYTLRFEARDAAGNKDAGSIQDINVQVDNTKGTTVVSSPSENAIVNSDFTVNATSSDDGSGIARGVANLYRANGTLLKSCYNQAVSPAVATRDFSCNVDIDSLQEGAYYLRVNASDRAGNVTNTVTRNFIVDKTAPALDVTAPEADSEHTTGQDITVTGMVSDNTDISRVVMFVDASNNGTRQVQHEFETQTGGTFSFTIPAGSLSVGEHRLVVNAYDEANNNTTVQIDFEVKSVLIGIPGPIDGDEEEPGNQPQEQPAIVSPAPTASSNSNGANTNPLTTVPTAIQQPSFATAFIGTPSQTAPTTATSEDDGDTLGTTATENDENGEVAGANDKAGWSIGDMAWYWWVLGVLGVMGLWLLIAAGIRRLRGSEV